MPAQSPGTSSPPALVAPGRLSRHAQKSAGTRVHPPVLVAPGRPELTPFESAWHPSWPPFESNRATKLHLTRVPGTSGRSTSGRSISGRSTSGRSTSGRNLRRSRKCLALPALRSLHWHSLHSRRATNWQLSRLGTISCRTISCRSRPGATALRIRSGVLVATAPSVAAASS